jgi:hypothetical protein
LFRNQIRSDSYPTQLGKSLSVFGRAASFPWNKFVVFLLERKQVAGPVELGNYLSPAKTKECPEQSDPPILRSINLRQEPLFGQGLKG